MGVVSSAWYSLDHSRHDVDRRPAGDEADNVDDIRILNGWQAYSNPSVRTAAIPAVGLDDAQWNHNNGDGIPIWRYLPESGLWLNGTFIGIDMVSNGWSWVMLGLSIR
jgi:hypothetical protein